MTFESALQTKWDALNAADEQLLKDIYAEFPYSEYGNLALFPSEFFGGGFSGPNIYLNGVTNGDILAETALVNSVTYDDYNNLIYRLGRRAGAVQAVKTAISAATTETELDNITINFSGIATAIYSPPV